MDSRYYNILDRNNFATVEEVAVPLRAGSFDEWWTRTTALAGPLANLLRTMPEDELRSRARDRVHAYLTPSGLEIPGVSLVASRG